MKKYVIAVLVLFFVTGCEKKNGVHCPVIINTQPPPEADLSQIKHIPEIMDTLAKYPELRVTRARFNWGTYDPTNYFASVACAIYYKGLLIFNKDYSIMASNVDKPYYSDTLPIKVNELSVEPAISREQAESIALKELPFAHCPSSQLGLMNVRESHKPFYKLVWQVREIEGGYPIVVIDAQSGVVLYSFDGIIID